MSKIWEAIGTLANESGGGEGNSLETLEPQDIAGVALFLRDGRVVLIGTPAGGQNGGGAL